jgi:hypothetical protein
MVLMLLEGCASYSTKTSCDNQGLTSRTWRRTIDPSKVVAAAVARVRIRIDIGVLRHQG